MISPYAEEIQPQTTRVLYKCLKTELICREGLLFIQKALSPTHLGDPSYI